MKRAKPTITHYVFVRMVVMLLVLLGVYYLIITQLLNRDGDMVVVDILLMATLLGIVLFVMMVRVKLIEKKLTQVNSYLRKLKNPKDFEDETHFATKEFEDIWHNLHRVLDSAREREEDKSKYNTKLKLKNRQRSDMLSAIAHEFRNPISSIIGYAQTLHEDPNISRPLQVKFLEKVYNNGYKIEDLLSRLILWNKFESGEAKCHIGSFDLFVLAKESAQLLEEKYQNRQVVVKGEESIVDADRTLIGIVLKNLIENALKYSSDEITIRINDKKVEVVDSGVGINKKDIDKVTKKFYRSGTHNWDNSMGLGLSIVKNILAMHRTKLHIESREGEGSAFSFELRGD